MARFKPDLPIIDQLITKKPPNLVIEATNIASKIMRFKVLSDRVNRGYQKVDRKGPKDAFETDGITRFTPKPNGFLQEAQSLGYTFETAGKRQPANILSTMTDKISLIDIDSTLPGIAGIPAFDYIELPFVPRELNYAMNSKFVGIATLSRNNPYYQFTGSEDTLSFEIDWFSNQLDRKDVINNCRWVEALTKADAYNHPPHRVILSWGSDNLLWQDDIWLCVSAPYTLSEFVRGYRKVKSFEEIDPRGEFISTSMLPQQARQQVVFKRISNLNLSHEKIKKPL